MKIVNKKALVVLSQILGNKIFSQMYRHALSEIKDVDFVYLDITDEDYIRFPRPMWLRFSSTWETVYVAKKKLQEDIREFDKFDLVIINGFEFVNALIFLFKECPFILILDTTPVLAQEMILKSSNGFLQRLRSRLLPFLSKFLYRRLFNRVAFFLPVSDWCAQSLIKHFSISPRKIKTIYPCFDLKVWRRDKDYPQKDKFQLLFVGNDFMRKGGDFLLTLYSRYLSGSYVLTIVTNDKDMRKKDLPEGVVLRCEIPHDQMPIFFQQTDLFVFPTKRDQLALVLAEALACGLPVMARDVGGISNIVKDRKNGFLMPYDSTEEDWAQKINYLHENRSILKRFGDNSRKIAEEKFDRENFTRTVRTEVEKFLVKDNKS
ncbi:MAG: glycosyltransferase family 4 protein [Candidatus Omnitrophica bacterium]|nr:glycosyltransferase family 4 protein [Candidatus Omnitrophota bacterium]